jgi:hypothetical protein
VNKVNDFIIWIYQKDTKGLGRQAGQIAKQYEVLLPLLKSPRSIKRGLFTYYFFTFTYSLAQKRLKHAV